MGSEVVQQGQNTTLKEYLEELCSYALSIGMSMHEYWEEDVELFNYYYKAEQIRQKKRNHEMWLQGAYVYNAIGSLAPILNGMSKEHRAQKYMKRPIPLTEEDRIEQQNQDALEFINKLDKFATKGEKKND